MQIINKFVLAALVSMICVSYSCVDAASPKLLNMKQVGFGNIEIPNNISNDEIRIKAIYFKVKEEAKRIKKVKINYTGTGDCIINGHISKYDLKAKWYEPYASTREKEEWSKERKWKDDKGKEQTMTITRYRTEPYGVPGGYYYSGYVDATLNLVSAKTDEILVSYSAYEIEDDEMTAWEKIVKGFYKAVNKSIKESKKLYKE